MGIVQLIGTHPAIRGHQERGATRLQGGHISHELQLLIDRGDVDAPAALYDHTADTDGSQVGPVVHTL